MGAAKEAKDNLLSNLKSVHAAMKASAEGGLPEEHESLRWFVYTREAAEMVLRTEGRNVREEGRVVGVVRPIDCEDVEDVEEEALAPPVGKEGEGEGEAEEGTFLFREDEGHEGHASREEVRVREERKAKVVDAVTVQHRYLYFCELCHYC